MTLDSRVKKKVAVIVGRFQVPELTRGHLWLFEEAIKKFERVLVLIGDTKVFPNGYKRMDSHDPYSYDIRKAMIQEWAWLTGNEENIVGIHRIEDIGNLGLWNEKLDEKLEFLDLGNYVMVGSRDSFAQGYRGKYEICILETPSELSSVSGTKFRDAMYKSIEDRLDRGGAFSPDFLEGMLYALQEKERLESLKSDGKV